MGIYTWVSVEPVTDVPKVLTYISGLLPYVDFWKIGKLNHGKRLGAPYARIEETTDWRAFLNMVELMIPSGQLLIKHDLETYRNPAEGTE